MAGATDSPNFPTVHPIQAAQGGQDAFVLKLKPAGNTLVYSTYYGGSGSDNAFGLAVDSARSAYITGSTSSPNLPSVHAIQAAQGGQDSYVAKLNAAGTALVYSTYLGGTGDETGFGIAVDSQRSAYVVGQTKSANFPTLHPIMAPQGAGDVYVTKLKPNGSALVYSTFLGGSGDDIGVSVAVDSKRNAYVCGQTSSPNFPAIHAIQGPAGGNDAFVCKLRPNGSALIFSTYLGGALSDYAWGVGIDSKSNVYLSGQTGSIDFPTRNPLQSDRPGVDGWAAKVKANGSALVYSTYLGGSGSDTAYGLFVDKQNQLYVVGQTDSADFITAQPFQVANGGASDGFLVKLK